MVPYYADILGAILPCIADNEEKIRVVSLLLLLLFSSKSNRFIIIVSVVIIYNIWIISEKVHKKKSLSAIIICVFVILYSTS